MHEYKLEDQRLANLGISQDAYVFCRLFTKSGPGPKNGEKYGAPLKEDEREDGKNCTILVASASPCSLRKSISCSRSFWDLRMNHTWRCGVWSFQLKMVFLNYPGQ